VFQIKHFFTILLKLMIAIALAIILFATFPLLNRLFHTDFQKEKVKTSKRTLLIQATIQQPPMPISEPKKLRSTPQSTVRSTQASGNNTSRFSPDLSLGGGDGPAVETGGTGFSESIYEVCLIESNGKKYFSKLIIN